MNATPAATMISTDPAQQALPLAGRHIVVTRPAQQAAPLCAAIAAAGGVAVAFPVLAIHPVNAAEARQLAQVLQRVCAAEFDLAIFVSPNAVAHSFATLREQGLQWPAQLPVAVVGKGSERALLDQGVASSQIISPQTRFDSEGLLALPAMQDMAGKRVIIFRGDGGRELTTSTLRARGATVSRVTSYRRSGPPADADLSELLQLWQDGQLDAITMTSSEGLRHLQGLFTARQLDQQLLQTTPMFAPHQRIAEEALKLGLTRVIATAAGDAGLMQGLSAYFADAGNNTGLAADGQGQPRAAASTSFSSV